MAKRPGKTVAESAAEMVEVVLPNNAWGTFWAEE